jgi:sulfhydrogenase subunit beta (sulfur reductase)
MVSEANVLVIDDEQTVCDSCTRILSQEGYRVRTALNGREGLEQIEGGHVDLAIVDLRMPETDGIAVLKKLRERRPETNVIVITGYASVASAVEAMKLGAVDYLPKPFTPDELSFATAKALERRVGQAAEVVEEGELIGEKLAVIMEPGDFREMLMGLGRYVYVPRHSAKGLSYSIAGDHPDEEVLWGGIRPIGPLKSFFFEPRTRVAVYPSRPSEVISAGSMADLQRVITGVKRCDLQALGLLDRIFLEGDFVDPFYKAARENALIVTTDCSNPAPSCSCVLMGLDPFCEEGFDLNVSEVSDGLIVEVGSPRGKQAIEAYAGRTREVETSHLVQREERRREVRKAITQMSGDFLPEERYEDVVREGADSPVWGKCAEACVGCAACTQICPTCHCFFLHDQSRPAGQSSVKGRYERIRTWDSCQYPAFARVAGGANPRKSREARFRHRYLHKFVDAREAYGTYACTGCGRCIDVCMGKIDMRRVLWELSGVKV